MHACNIAWLLDVKRKYKYASLQVCNILLLICGVPSGKYQDFCC